MSLKDALTHLEDAETTILNWWSRLDDSADDEGYGEVEFTTMIAAVLRSVARAAGVIEAIYVDAEIVDE